MNPTRKMWISAGVVGAVLVGGISVAAAAATGRVESEKAGRTSESSTTYAPGEAPGQIPGPDVPANAEPTSAPSVFVDDQMNRDPKKVAEYWTEKRLEEAEPLPIPVITGEKKPK
ncbi:hypothetical protein [Sphaerisporangium rhizosphaerae]|uniref:Uncharacterized protein n=1 Tax=Sphaerisporangium rhizosphaerae TaxID=2269375 RepID=A0ABW2P8V4_9ACTN